jgi:uncharacterized membrane protein YccF (DUF307 family)
MLSPATRPRPPRRGNATRYERHLIALRQLWLAILYSLAGRARLILIITIPFGFAAFRMARFCLWPFGRTLVKKATSGVGSVIGNIIWVVLFGWELALAHLLTGIAQCITIIGIPARPRELQADPGVVVAARTGERVGRRGSGDGVLGPRHPVVVAAAG